MLSHHIPCEVREHPGTIQPDFSAWKAPQEVLEQVAAQSNFFGTSNTHAQSHQKGCSSYSTRPNTMDGTYIDFLENGHFWVFGSQSKWREPPKKWQFCSFLPKQRTLATPKPLKISTNVFPPHSLIS